VSLIGCSQISVILLNFWLNRKQILLSLIPK